MRCGKVHGGAEAHLVLAAGAGDNLGAHTTGRWVGVGEELELELCRAAWCVSWGPRAAGSTKARVLSMMTRSSGQTDGKGCVELGGAYAALVLAGNAGSRARKRSCRSGAPFGSTYTEQSHFFIVYTYFLASERRTLGLPEARRSWKEHGERCACRAFNAVPSVTTHLTHLLEGVLWRPHVPRRPLRHHPPRAPAAAFASCPLAPWPRCVCPLPRLPLPQRYEPVRQVGAGDAGGGHVQLEGGQHVALPADGRKEQRGRNEEGRQHLGGMVSCPSFERVSGGGLAMGYCRSHGATLCYGAQRVCSASVGGTPGQRQRGSVRANRRGATCPAACVRRAERART